MFKCVCACVCVTVDVCVCMCVCAAPPPPPAGPPPRRRPAVPALPRAPPQRAARKWDGAGQRCRPGSCVPIERALPSPPPLLPAPPRSGLGAPGQRVTALAVPGSDTGTGRGCAAACSNGCDDGGKCRSSGVARGFFRGDDRGAFCLTRWMVVLAVCLLLGMHQPLPRRQQGRPQGPRPRPRNNRPRNNGEKRVILHGRERHRRRHALPGDPA